MKIGDEVFVHGFVDEIRVDQVIIKNRGGYFGTLPDEAIVGSIVRCKDCKYAEHREQAERVYCHRERLAISCPPRDNDDFCKYGERSEE